MQEHEKHLSSQDEPKVKMSTLNVA